MSHPKRPDRIFLHARICAPPLVVGRCLRRFLPHRTTVTKQAPPFAFFFLHTATAWPIGVVSLALANNLVRAGVSVRQVAAMVAATSLAFTFEFVWAPLVDSSLTRKAWYVIGATMMCVCLFAMFVIPWKEIAVQALTLLAFTSCTGAAIAAVAVKGIMAYDVQPERMGVAGGFYTAGGTFAKASAGAGTLLLLTHLSSKTFAACLSIAPAVVAASAIALAAPGSRSRLRELGAKMAGSLLELWHFIRTRNGLLIALLCVLPFGTGTEAGLIGAISREWSVSPNQLALFSTLGAGTNITGAIVAGWLATRIGPWTTYIGSGLTMIVVMIVFAFVPRTSLVFLGAELLYRALAVGCYAALLSIVMAAIGKGAASTKAAVMWSLTNFSVFYPTLIEGTVHDRRGTAAMLLTDAVLGATGFAILLIALRMLGARGARVLVPCDLTKR
jgi:PAT family beta-lactamase induction signal transducer AmpG